MKKKIILFAVIVLIVATLCAALYYRWDQEQTYIQTDFGPIRRDTTELVLSADFYPSTDVLSQLTCLAQIDARQVSLTAEEYESLKAAASNAVVLWKVPFRGDFLPEETAELLLSDPEPSDLTMLRYFPALHTVDLGLLQDFAVLTQLQSSYPQLTLRYSVSLNGAAFSHDVTRMELEDADIAQVAAALPYLPAVQEVTFTGTAPANDAIYDLMTAFPDISFLWDLEVFGTVTPNAATVLDLSGIPMKSTAEVEQYLKYFPKLERVEMCDCGISSEEMGALCQRYPNIKFVWNIRIRGKALRTDATAFIPFKLGFNIDTPLYDSDCKELKYCTDLICLDLGHMKLRDVSFLEHMPNMQYLVLVDMPCRDFTALGNLKELVYLELFNVWFTQHDLLLNMTKLEDLNISSTPTADIDVLRQMTWLDRLWITRTHLTKEQLRELQDVLPDTQVVYNAYHSTDKGWRNNDNYRKMRDLLGMFYMD